MRAAAERCIRTSNSGPAGAGQLKRLHDGALSALLTTPNALSRPKEGAVGLRKASLKKFFGHHRLFYAAPALLRVRCRPSRGA